eukprot:10802273-Alexandrium_andersonii.AAC.1
MVLKARISWDDCRGSMVRSKTVGAPNASRSLALFQGPPGMQTFSTNKSRRKRSACLALAAKALLALAAKALS